MTTAAKIRFKTQLLRPTEALKGSSWTFLVLPKTASAKLPTRAVTTVKGVINGRPFRATLEPDGRKSHWLKVDKHLRESAGAAVGDLVQREIVPAEKATASRLPADLRKALAAARSAHKGLSAPKSAD